MDIVIVLLLAAVVFGVCFLVDKAFTTLFRNQQERHSGKAIRLNKKYGSIGLIVAVMGVALLFNANQSVLMYIAGSVLVLTGAGLVVYYMTYGIYYDTDTFLVTNFGKKSVQYRYENIVSQQIYNSYGNIVIELYMTSGAAVQVQTGMKGAYDFLDHAFAAWCRQMGRNQEDCAAFYDPDNSCWFPKTEDV
jgi:amino acid permease